MIRRAIDRVVLADYGPRAHPLLLTTENTVTGDVGPTAPRQIETPVTKNHASARLRLLAALIAAAAATVLTTSSATAATTAGDSTTLSLTSPGSVASNANAARLPGWALPAGTSQDAEVTAAGAFRISNGTRAPFFSHGGYVTPGLTVSAAETAVSPTSVNTFDTSFTIASTTGGYQEGLNIGIAFGNADQSWGRYGGNLYFIHKNNVLNLVSFWAEPSKNGTPPVASASIVWTETVHATLDPSVSHDIRAIVRFNEGPDNDVVEIYADGVRVGTAGTFEGYVQIKADPVTQPAAAVGALNFMSGSNTTSSAGLSLISSAARVPALLGQGFAFSQITYATYDVEADPVAAPDVSTLPAAPSTTPDASLVLPPSSDADTQVTATGSGFDPYEVVDFTMYSTPTYVGWARADAFGNVSHTFTVPSTVSAGQVHTVQAVGQRSARTVNSTLTITASALAATGLDDGMVVAAGAGALLLLGAGGLAVAVSRRRARV